MLAYPVLAEGDFCSPSGAAIRGPISQDQKDRRRFLETLAEACENTVPMLCRLGGLVNCAGEPDLPD